MPTPDARKSGKSAAKPEKQAKPRRTTSRGSAAKSTKSRSTKSRSTKSRGRKSRGTGATGAVARNGSESRKAAGAPRTNHDGHGEAAPGRGGGQRAAPKDKRQLVQERKLLRSQSRWLQKALFALSKAEDDQEKLSEVRGERHEPMVVTVGGATHELGEVTDSLREAVMARLEALRVTLRDEHALLG